jgi:hypothetical protein
LKLRFDTTKGWVSTEDLWELSLTTLDKIGMNLRKLLRETSEEVSLITTKEKKDKELQLKFDVVKYIIDIKVKERVEAKAASERSAKKQQLLGILARKQDAELENKTPEELTAMINSL